MNNQNLFILKYILPPNRDPTLINPRSRFGGISSHFAGALFSVKRMRYIFKGCRKTFNEKRNKNRSQINELFITIFSKKYFKKQKLVHAAKTN